MHCSPPKLNHLCTNFDLEMCFHSDIIKHILSDSECLALVFPPCLFIPPLVVYLYYVLFLTGSARKTGVRLAFCPIYPNPNLNKYHSYFE